MTAADYLIDSALVLVVLLQLKERRLTAQLLLRPLAIVAIAVAVYARAVPTAGNDPALIAGVGLLGGVIGIASGASVIMRRGPQGAVLVRGGWLSAAFWVLGMGSRFAFLVWMTHGGAAAVARFSATHGITSTAAWVDALLAMAVLEVIGRTLTQAIRRRTSTRVPAASTASTARAA